MGKERRTTEEYIVTTETADRLETAIRARNAFGHQIAAKLGTPDQHAARTASMSATDREAADAEYWARMTEALDLLSEHDREVAAAAEANLVFEYRAEAARTASVELPEAKPKPRPRRRAELRRHRY
jgi:hypothetical protein